MRALNKIAGRAPAEAGHQLPATEFPPVDNYQIQPLTVRIREACRISGIGRSKLYELIKAREIAIIKVGGITLVPMESLKAFLGINRPDPDREIPDRPSIPKPPRRRSENWKNPN